MVLFKNKSFFTNSVFPNTDFMGNADFVIPDDSELAEKIIGLYPDFDIVFDDDGNIVLVFSKYQAGPGYMGCPEFTIAAKKFNKHLK